MILSNYYCESKTSFGGDKAHDSSPKSLSAQQHSEGSGDGTNVTKRGASQASRCTGARYVLMIKFNVSTLVVHYPINILWFSLHPRPTITDSRLVGL